MEDRVDPLQVVVEALLVGSFQAAYAARRQRYGARIIVERLLGLGRRGTLLAEADSRHLRSHQTGVGILVHGLPEAAFGRRASRGILGVGLQRRSTGIQRN